MALHVSLNHECIYNSIQTRILQLLKEKYFFIYLLNSVFMSF